MRERQKRHADVAIMVDGQPLPVEVKRHPRSRSISLRLARNGAAAVLTMPYGVPVAEGLHFAQSREHWLTKRLAAQGKAMPLCAGAILPLRGTEHKIVWQADAARAPILRDGYIVLGGPQQNVGPRLVRWLRVEALRQMRVEATEYFLAAGLANLPNIALSNAERRWGSCSSAGTIRLQWRLIMAPDWVRRSVIAHEVAHIKYMDHSKAFYAWMDRLYEGDRKAADRWLKTNGAGLYRYTV